MRDRAAPGQDRGLGRVRQLPGPQVSLHSPPEGLQFAPAPRLRQIDVEALLVDAIGRIGRQLARHLPGEDEDDRDRLAEREPALAALLRAAILGQHRSEREPAEPLRIGKGPVQPKPHGRNCAQALGFSLHANTRVGELNRTGLDGPDAQTGPTSWRSGSGRRWLRGLPCSW